MVLTRSYLWGSGEVAELRAVLSQSCAPQAGWKRLATSLIIKPPASASSTFAEVRGPPVGGKAVNEAAGRRAVDAVALIQPWLGLNRWPVPEWEVTGKLCYQAFSQTHSDPGPRV